MKKKAVPAHSAHRHVATARQHFQIVLCRQVARFTFVLFSERVVDIYFHWSWDYLTVSHLIFVPVFNGSDSTGAITVVTFGLLCLLVDAKDFPSDFL